MAENKKRKHRLPAKGHGMSYADQLKRQKDIEAAIKAAAESNTVNMKADIRCQRLMWLTAIALHDRHGFGPDRIRQTFEEIDKLADGWEAEAKGADWDYANEQLRKRAEQVTGMTIEPIHEREAIEAKKIHDAQGITLDPLYF